MALLLYLDSDFLYLNSLHVAVGSRQNKEQSTIPVPFFPFIFKGLNYVADYIV